MIQTRASFHLNTILRNKLHQAKSLLLAHAAYLPSTLLHSVLRQCACIYQTHELYHLATLPNTRLRQHESASHAHWLCHLPRILHKAIHRPRFIFHAHLACPPERTTRPRSERHFQAVKNRGTIVQFDAFSAGVPRSCTVGEKRGFLGRRGCRSLARSRYCLRFRRRRSHRLVLFLGEFIVLERMLEV